MTNAIRHTLAKALGALIAATVSPVVMAQSYPTKPIRLIVPSAPGGGTDIAARLIAQGLTESFGQAVVVDNRGGAGGIAGVTVAAKLSAPDGYTLVLGSNGHLSFASAIYPKLPYDPQKDLTPISLVANQPFVFAVSTAVPANSIREYIALAKSKPGTITYGSGGVGSASHLGVALFEYKAGVTLMHIPYKGTGPGMSALMSGELQTLMAGLATVLPQAKSGKIRVLAVSGAQRSRMAPEVPTVAEAGVPGYDFNVWYGMMATGGTPRPIVMKLAGEISRMLKAPIVLERFATAGLEPVSNTPDEFAALLQREIPEWRKIAKAANIRVEN
jgi:tripartite-type tricarboxylate transporter receptor subunit TctC